MISHLSGNGLGQIRIGVIGQYEGNYRNCQRIAVEGAGWLEYPPYC